MLFGQSSERSRPGRSAGGDGGGEQEQGLEREWDGLIAHREFPMTSLDNNAAERMIRGPS